MYAVRFCSLFLRFLSITLSAGVLFAGSIGCLYGQDLFNGAVNSASLGVGHSDVALPRGVLGAVSIGNPAGIGLVEGRSLEVGGLAILAHGTYTSATSTNSRLDPLLGVAPAAAFVTGVGKTPWRISVSATPDVSLAANWYYNDAPGTAGVTYGYQQNKSSLLNERFAVGVAHPLGKKVQVGGTFGVVYDSTTLIAPTIFQQQPVLKGLKTLLTMKTTGVGWNGSIGVIYAPTPNVHLGVTYRTPTAINSTGTAVGNLSALVAALGLTGKFQPDFRYSSKFNYTLPQIGRVGVAWSATNRTKVFASVDFVGWGNAFDHLGLAVSDGTNADLNGLVGSNGFHDVIPLSWSNQTIVHAGVERAMTPSLILRGGFVAGNDPVPSATLTPLTASITRASLAAGVGYRRGRYALDAGYQAGLPHTASVGQSILRAGEYNNSQTEISTQTLATTFAVSF